jgi:hypothetical protein
MKKSETNESKIADNLNYDSLKVDTYLITNEYISTKIGSTSLVGTMGKPPHSFGNYFCLQNVYNKPCRVVNFWAENLEAADKEFNLNGKVKVRQYLHIAEPILLLVDDWRIPKSWYYNKLCFTGTTLPSIDVLKDMFNHVGDESNELERYTDPESYYLKRGQKYVASNVGYSLSKIDTKE